MPPTPPHPARPKRFVIALRCGRLANRMVLFANFIALAEEQGHRVINFTFHSYAEFFETTRRDIYCSYPPPARRSWWDAIPAVANGIRKSRLLYHAVRYGSRLNGKFPLCGRSVVTMRENDTEDVVPLDAPRILDPLRSARTVFVYGWRYRAPALVRRHAEKIRAYFRPVQAHAQASRQAVETLRQQADILVGVHIRQGDYQGWKGGHYFFETARYAEWMRETAALFPGRRVAFLVCSNEARRPEEFAGLTVGFGPGTAVGDLYALAGCDYLVGPLSSFTQWASFYGDKPLFHLRDQDARIRLEDFHVSDLAEVP
jgi:hypothetical protein